MASRSEQQNRNMRLIAQFLMNKQLMGQRQEGQMGLETERHENMMARLGEDFSNKIARDPTMERHRALIFKARERGQDTSALEEAMKKDALEISKVAFTTATGSPWTKDTADAATLLTEDALVRMGIRGARTTEQARDIIEVQKPGQKLRGREVTVREAAQTSREEELTFEQEKEFGKEGKAGKQYREDYIKLVHRAQDFLKTEGIEEGDPMSEQDRIMFGSGRVPDPLSSENRGKAFTFLGEIEQKLIKGGTLTSGEESFLNQVRNTAAIQKGGMISPGIGLTPDEEGKGLDKVSLKLIEMATQEFMKQGGFDEATARQKAIALISGLK